MDNELNKIKAMRDVVKNLSFMVSSYGISVIAGDHDAVLRPQREAIIGLLEELKRLFQ